MDMDISSLGGLFLIFDKYFLFSCVKVLNLFKNVSDYSEVRDHEQILPLLIGLTM